MKYITAVFLSFIFFIPDGSALEIKADLSKGGIVYFPGRKETMFAPYSVADGGIHFRSSTGTSDHLVLALKAPVKITSYEELHVKAVFRTEKDSPLLSLDLRLRDRDWERCVVRCSSLKREDGLIFAEWKVLPERQKTTWGVSGEKQNFFMDLPLWVGGFGISYDRKENRDFSLTLRSLEIRAVQESGVFSVRELYSFGEDCLVRQSGGYRLLPSPDALTVCGIHSKQGWLKERKADLILYREKPHSIFLDAEALSEAVLVSWTVADAAGVLHTTPVQSISGARKIYRFNFPDGEAVQRPYRVRTLNLQSAGRKHGALILYGSRLRTFSNIAEALKFDVFTGTPVHVLKNEDQDAFHYLFHNTSETDGRFCVEITLTPWCGESLKEAVEFDLKAGARTRIRPRIRPERNGHWTATARISVSGGEEVSVQSVTFAKLTPAGPTPVRSPHFLFGVCSHPLWWSRRDRELEAMAAAFCGIKYLRATPEWPAVQPAPDKWNFRGVDVLLEQNGALGMELQGFLGYTPRWAAKPEVRNADFRVRTKTMPDLAALSRYAAKMAGRYRGLIRYWELYNEPDLARNAMTAGEFSEVQKTAYRAVKSANPGAVMMSGGFAGEASHPGLTDRNFMETVLKNARGCYEVHLTHNHGFFANYVKTVETHLIPLRKRSGADKVPWFPNETGISSPFGTVRNQALTLYKKLIYSWSRGAIGYLWYDLRNDGFDTREGEHNYGMMTTDFYPKPVYSVYNHLAGTFRNAKYASRLPLPDGVWGFLFDSPGEKLLSLWNEREYPVQMALRTDAEQVLSSDFMGNETPLPVMDGIVLAEAGAEPKTLRFFHAEKVESLPPLVLPDKLDVAVPGGTMFLRLNLSNPFREAREFRLSLADLPFGFLAERKSLNVKVPASQTVAVDFKIAVPSAGQFAFRPDSFSLVCESGRIRTVMRIPVNPAKLIRKEKGGKADFVQNQASQVVSLTEADPALAHRVWKGPRDQSAEVRLFGTPSALEIGVDVMDDVHNQPYSGFFMWKGDCVQICFKIPEQDGFWELGVSLPDSGGPEVFVFHAPSGFDRKIVARAVRLNVVRKDAVTSYRLSLPLKTFGLTSEQLRRGFRFNLLVNENDGEGRDGWIQIASGIGETKNPAIYPFILFE